MELTTKQKNHIRGVFESIDTRYNEFEDAVETVLDSLIDNDIVDLSDDENGDLYEELYNIVWDYIEKYPNNKD
jgi:hypothetical protein